MGRRFWALGAVSASALVAAVACKKTSTSKKTYPIVDERGDLPLVGTLAAELQSPFSLDDFDDKTCLTQQNLGAAQNVGVRLNIDEVTDHLNQPRLATSKVLDIDSVFSFRNGLLSSHWFDPFSSRLAETSNAKIDLDEFEKKEDGVAAAYAQIAADTFKRTVTSPSKPFMPCDVLNDGRLDLTVGRSRVHAAFGIAALLGREVKFLESHVAKGAPLFPTNFRVSPFGLNLLGEQVVDYSFVAPDLNGVKTRFYQRFSAIDNMAFWVNNNYSETLSGSEFHASRRFVVTPHSTFFAKEFIGAGAFYKTPFVAQHEFGHLIFAESVRRATAVTLTESAFSFAKAAMYVPKVLLGIDREKSYNDIRELRDRGGRHDTTALSTHFQLLDGVNSKNLSSSERAELVRRVEYIMRSIEEAYADYYALARSGHYGGFRLGCVGTDRDPRVEKFGLGNVFQLAKKIPTGINLNEFFGDEDSWKAQAMGTDRVLLSERNECTGRPQTLQRPYVLASILTNWIHDGLTELFSKPFAEFNESARINFVLASVEALKHAWMPWTTMVDEGFRQGRFSSFTDSRNNAELLSIVNQVSLQKSLSAVLTNVFSNDANGWYNLYRDSNGPTALSARNKMCDLAKERGIMNECI